MSSASSEPPQTRAGRSPVTRDSGPSGIPGYIGISLRRRLSTLGALSLAEASHLLDALAEQIDDLHHQGIVHGGICPETIWLMPNGTIRIFQPARTAIAESRAHMARIGYAAPEEHWGETPGSAADIWALGNLLFDMLAGSAAPESGPRSGAALEAIGRRIAPAGPIVDGAMTTAPADRYHSGQAMANALWTVVPQVEEAPTQQQADVSAAARPSARPAGAAHPQTRRPIGSRMTFGGGREAQPALPSPTPVPKRVLDDDEPPPSRTQRGRGAARGSIPSLFRRHGAPGHVPL